MSLQTVKSQAKYGLIKKGNATKSKAPVNVPRKVSCFFQYKDDLLEEDDVEEESGKNKSSQRRGGSNRSEISKVNYLIKPNSSKTQESDLEASIYDYDGEYDNFKQQKETEQQEKAAKLSASQSSKPQYIANLMNMAKVREKEKDRIYERKLLIERKAEDEQYADQPKFITTAYKNKLLEEKKWNYEDQLAEEVEKRTDVRGSGMSGFYANLLTKNIAMGGDVSTSAVSAYTAGSQRQQQALSLVKLEEDSDKHVNAASSSSSSSSHDDKMNQRAIRDSDDRITSSSSSSSERHLSKRSLSDDEPSGIPHQRTRIERESSSSVTENEPVVISTATASVTRDTVILSAKERYLARKQQQQQSLSLSSSSLES